MRFLIKNGIIVTMDKKGRVIKDGALLVEDDKIVDVGKAAKVKAKPKPDKVIDARGKLVMPGLIDAHTHMLGCLVRGLGADMGLLEWLQKHQWPFLANVKEKEARVGGLLGCAEAIKTGSTFVVENYYSARDKKGNIDEIAKAIEKSGIRGLLVRGYHDNDHLTPEVFIEEKEEVLKEYERIIRRWHGASDGRIMAWIGPVNLLFCTLETLACLKGLAEKYGVGFHTHVAESKREVELVEKEFGRGYVEVFNDLGLLGPKFHAVHSVWLSQREMEMLARTKSKVVHNPESNMYLSSGFAPIPELLSAGVDVALGTDGGNCNNNQDMIESMRAAAFLHKVHSLNPTIISAKDVMRMATINGAKALGLEAQLGSLEAGKKADIVIVNLKSPHISPVHDPIPSIVYSANGNDVDTTIVDGKILMEGRRILTLDEDKLVEEAQRVADDLVSRAKIK